jgi:lysophospholipase L1-like esterase
MRVIALAAAGLLICFSPVPPAAGQPVDQPAGADQPAADQPASAAIQPVPATEPFVPSGTLQVVWEVKNRFRLFRNEKDFQRHVAAGRGDGVLAAERRLAAETDGRGWAKDALGRLCVDAAGRLVETCQRDGEKENYLAPEDHRVGVRLHGPISADATCTWSFNDGMTMPPQQATVPCGEEVRLRARYGRTTVAAVGVTRADGTVDGASAEIQVRDLLIAGLGDSVAAGEGNPDRPVTLADEGFCFRRFLGSGEYFRPSRAGFKGNKACDDAPAGPEAAAAAGDWERHAARWMSAACHNSLYGYQSRTALALAVENPQIAVTFLPLACSGATIDAGVFNAQRARECPASGNCAGSVPAQLTQLRDALARARKILPERSLDLVLLTVGANDIKFSGMVADVILASGVERVLFQQGGLIASADEAQRILDREIPAGFAKLRAALKPMVGGGLSRVVFVSYGNPAMRGGAVCPGGRDGFDVHPAFTADGERLRRVSEFVSGKFLPRLKALARCEAGVICKQPETDRMTFVDGHHGAFAEHGVCARAETDPEFDRECFSSKGESFNPDLASAATAPLACERRPNEFRPYASRARWFRTANDSYFTAMTFPRGLPATAQPNSIHDAAWGAMSAVYGGAVHPTAEGHAAMADAALPAVRQLLGLAAPPEVTAAPLPPLQTQGSQPGPAIPQAPQ